MNAPSCAGSKALAGLLLCLILGSPVVGGDRPHFQRVVFGSPAVDLADFERFAARAKQSGATHITITAEDLPWSFWQYDTPGDPYPAWVISNLGLLKIAPPAAVRPYIPAEYPESIMSILEARCKVLRRLGLKAAFATFEPQMLPEAFFDEHPGWRGARVDHPNRSRVARFAPSLDHPEVLALYREAIAALVRRCPEIDFLTMRTNDSGAGIDWSRGLYSGPSGNTAHQQRPMEQRIRDFLGTLQQGAEEAGAKLELELYNTKELDRPRLARALTGGMAIDNLEGPEATPFKASVDTLLVYNNFFHPVLGIPRPVQFLEDLEQAAGSKARLLFVAIPDRVNRDLYFRLYDRFWKAPATGEIARLTLLKEIAAMEAGERDAERLLSLWLNLRAADKTGSLLTSGGAIAYLGCVQQRWLTRPLVPFPAELKPEEKDYYRRFQFQARTEAHADNLADLQAAEMYSGWSGRFLVGKILGEADGSLGRAHALARGLQGVPSCSNLQKRLEVLRCFLRTARNAVSFQAQLDRVRELGVKPENRPVTGAAAGWDRQMMIDTARAETDNIVALIELIEPSPRDLIELAANKQEEDIRMLGPDLVEQLQKKVRIMNAHWQDYNRIFTKPN